MSTSSSTSDARPPKGQLAGLNESDLDQSPEHRIVELEREVARLRELVHNDPLTGALTRHGLTVHLSPFFAEIHNALQGKGSRKTLLIQAISILFLDIDNFKNVNDTHGHDTGDAVLKDVVQTINTVVRDYDLVCRWGGEEIVVSLLGPDESKAAEIAEKIRTAITSAVKAAGTSITASIGVAEISAETETIAQLIGRADSAMYVAKRERGKNTVVRYSETQ